MNKCYKITPFDGDAEICIESDRNGEGGLIFIAAGEVMGEPFEVSFLLLPSDIRELLLFADEGKKKC